MVLRDAERAAKHTQSSSTASARPAGKPSSSPEVVNAVQDPVVDYGNLPEYSCTSVSEAVLTLAGDAVLLDSGATSHLIRDCLAFWTYDTSRASTVRTANHGTLPTLARGDCVVLLRCGTETVKVRLHDCLHAPNAVTNLLSVGRLANKGFCRTFESSRVVITTPI